MTAFDYALLFLLICSVVIGTMRGLLREILSLASWIVAFIVANLYGEVLAPMLPDAIPGQTIRLIAAFVILFIAVKIAVMILAKAIDSLVNVGGLKGVNRMLGSIFGLARGGLIALVVVLLCGMTSIPQQPFWKEAVFSPMAEEVATMTLPYLPDSIAGNIKY